MAQYIVILATHTMEEAEPQHFNTWEDMNAFMADRYGATHANLRYNEQRHGHYRMSTYRMYAHTIQTQEQVFLGLAMELPE